MEVRTATQHALGLYNPIRYDRITDGVLVKCRRSLVAMAIATAINSITASKVTVGYPE
jgi:hypothetical protein